MLRTDTEKREREDCDEIGNMTRSGRCFKPDNLRTDGDKEKDKEKEKDFEDEPVPMQ
jgi:hypothetical protein